MPLFRKAPRTVRELLAQRYAYLVRAAAARGHGAERYTTAHHMLAVAFYRDVMAGAKRIRADSFYDDERARLHGPARCAYCGAYNGLSVDPDTELAEP